MGLPATSYADIMDKVNANLTIDEIRLTCRKSTTPSLTSAATPTIWDGPSRITYVDSGMTGGCNRC